MQLLLPLFLSSVLVAAVPHPRPAVETVVVTQYAYVEEQSTQATPAPVAPEVAYVAPPAEPVATSTAQAPTIQIQNKQTTSSSDTIDGLARMSDSDINAIYKTCWNGALQWPLPSTPKPCVDVVAPQLKLFPVPAAQANTLTVHNYCGYPIYYNHFGGASLLQSGNIPAGKSFTGPLTGSVFKASKSSGMGKDMLIEYAVANGQLYYDLSLITCLGSTGSLSNGDTSACAGHEAGLQLGNAQAKTFQCAPGTWCDDQVYLYQENLCKKQNPVTSCSPDHGLTMEFCASMKS